MDNTNYPVDIKDEQSEGLLAHGLPHHRTAKQYHNAHQAIASVLFFGLRVLVLLLALIGTVFLFLEIHDEFGRRELRVGQDWAGGFVPKNVNASPRLLATTESSFEITAATFETASDLNDTVMMWNLLAPGASFVSTEVTTYDGTEVPIATNGHGGVFQIAALHQMHCLTTILRDYSLLLMGNSPNQLYNDRPIEVIRGHSAHCFNEIRRALTCLADGTALGHGEDPFVTESKGKLHVCNDYESLLRWATDPVRKMPDDTRGGY